MKRTPWLRGWSLTGPSRSPRRFKRCDTARRPAELLEVRTLLSATAIAADGEATEGEAVQELPDNVALTYETGYFEVAVDVPVEVFDIDWGEPLSPDDFPILIDDGAMLGDESEIDPVAVPPDSEFDPGQDILVSVGMFGFPLAEMFGGALPDEEGLNDFLVNGPSEDGILSQLFVGEEEGSGIEVGIELLDLFSDGALKHISLHEDGIEVSASLYKLMREPQHDGPDSLFGEPEDDIEFEDDPFFEDDPEFEEDDDSLFPDELIATVQVEHLPVELVPDWLRFANDGVKSGSPIPQSDAALPGESEEDDSSAEADEPVVVDDAGFYSFESSVPIAELMIEALITTVFYTLDSDPTFEFTDPPEDFEPDPEDFFFSLGLHLVDFEEADENGHLPGLGIDGDYDFCVTLIELAGGGDELFGIENESDQGATDEASEGDDQSSGFDPTIGYYAGDAQLDPHLAAIAMTADDGEAADDDGAVPDGQTATIRLSLQFVDEDDAEPDAQPLADPEPLSLPVISFDENNVQLNEGTLTINLPETEHGGWTATASGSDLIFDFESEHRDESHTVSLTGATALVINGTRSDDFLEIDLTGLDAPDLMSIAAHGGTGDDGIDLIGAERDRFDQVLLTGGFGDDVLSVGLTQATVVLRGGAGDDALFGGSGGDEILGGDGEDLLDGGAGMDQIHGGRGDDLIFGGGGHDSMWGGAGDDRIVGHAGRDRAFGGAGNDSIMGGRGRDHARGGSGNDMLDGGAGRDTLRGGIGRDNLMGRSGNDRMFGGADDDTLDGSSGRDLMKGGDGDDEIRGGKGNDRMFGGRGRDRMFGSRGQDLLEGGEDSDFVYGNDGDDTVIGLQQDDFWQGGRGGNVRHFAPMPPGPADTDEPEADPPTDAENNDAGFEDFDQIGDAL